MILAKLVALQGRLEGAGQLGEAHLARKSVHLAVVLDRSGRALRAEAMYERKGQFLSGRPFMVPHPPKNRVGRTPPPCLLYERADYVLGLPVRLKDDAPAAEAERERAKAAASQARFRDAIAALPPEVRRDEGVAAALAFAKRPELGRLADDPGIRDMLRLGGVIALRLDGDAGEDGAPRLILERPAVREHCRARYLGEADDALPPALCTVTGVVAPVARLHGDVGGIADAKGNPTEATLVSYNSPAFESWGLGGAANASISVAAERAYTAALTAAIRWRGARVGAATYVAWPDGEADAGLEDSFAALLGIGEAGRDPLDAQEVIGALRAPLLGGGLAPAPDGEYNVLGLSAALSRAVVRLWRTGPASELRRHVADHLEDFSDPSAPGGRRVLPLWRIMAALAPKGEAARLPPALGTQILDAALTGRAYPQLMLATAVRRYLGSRPGKDGMEEVRNRVRARCVRAWLSREARLDEGREGAPMALDTENVNPGYRLGRLFAAYERIQRTADPRVNATLRDSMFSSAMQAPARVFPLIERRSVHHLARVRKSVGGGLAHFYETLVGEIVGGLTAEGGYPEALEPEDAARFVLGYHHQMAARKPKEAEEAEAKADTVAEAEREDDEDGPAPGGAEGNGSEGE